MKGRLPSTNWLILILLITSSILVPLMFLSNTSVEASPDWLSGWTYRRELTIDSSLVDDALTDFPVLVKLDSAFFDFSDAKTNGEDVRFTSSDGTTQLKYEIESWDSTGGKAEIWVKIPSVSSTTDTDFYMYYGNSGASDAQDPTNVWDSNYKMIQHLEETSGTVTDSTSNGNDGTAYNGTTQGATGKIDGASEFDGVDDCIGVPHDNSLNLGTSDFTISVWVKYPDTPTNSDSDILRKGNTGDTPPNNYKLELAGGKIAGNLYDGGNSHVETTGTYDDDNWHFVVFLRETGTIYLYVDGTQDGSASDSGRDVSNTATMGIGSKNSLNDDHFDGIIDEVRISNTARSEAWIEACYSSMNDDLLTYGSEEFEGQIELTVTSPQEITYYTTTVALEGSTDLEADITYSLDGQDPVTVAEETTSFSTSVTGLSYSSHSITVYAVESDDESNTDSTTIDFTVEEPQPWGCPDCRYRTKLTFDNTASSENLVEFPVLVVLNPSRIDYSKTSATDIRFYDGSTLLPKDTELWNPSGDSYIWVKVPQIDNTDTDFIYAYYGCVGGSNVDDPTAVWSGYAMVQHLNEASGTLFDSTSNDNDGTPAGGLTQGATGKIAGGVDFDGSNDYITVTDDATLDFGTGSFSYMFWFRSRATGTQYVFVKQPGTLGATNAGYKMGISTDTNKRYSASIGDGAHNARVDAGYHASWGTNVWALLTVVVDRTEEKMVIYLDGVEMNSVSTSSVGNVDSSLDLIIGRHGTASSNWFNGMMDEARVQNVAWSADWIEACYNSMDDNFITYGAEGTPNRLIESCDSGGDEKNTFDQDDAVRVFGSGYEASATYPIYVVDDDETTWDGGETLVRVSGTETTVTSDSNGNINPTIVWNPTLAPGKYDIVLDFNENGYYDVGIDALDNDDVVTSAAFFVIPEYLLGALMALFACFAAYLAFKKTKMSTKFPKLK
jgi:hypothetical protein